MAVYKIAFSGAHSTGKTTAFNAVYRYLSDKGFAIYPIQGIARSSPFPLNKDATPEGQRWIFYKQAMLEEEAALKIRQSGEDGVILCERSIFDNLVYSFYLGTQGDLTQYKHNYLERLWHFNKDLAALAEKLTFYKPSTLLFRTILREGIAV
jgi:thymidylate kinase